MNMLTRDARHVRHRIIEELVRKRDAGSRGMLRHNLAVSFDLLDHHYPDWEGVFRPWARSLLVLVRLPAVVLHEPNEKRNITVGPFRLLTKLASDGTQSTWLGPDGEARVAEGNLPGGHGMTCHPNAGRLDDTDFGFDEKASSVLAGALCHGAFGAPVTAAADQMRLFDVIVLSREVVSVYGAANPHLDLRAWFMDDWGENTYTCAECGDDIEEDAERYEADGDVLCEDCACACEQCGQEIYSCDSLRGDVYTYCTNCASTCDQCEAVTLHEDMQSVRYNSYCSDCVERCRECDEYDLPERMTAINDRWYCEDCWGTCDDCEDTFAASDLESSSRKGESLCSDCAWECEGCSDVCRRDDLHEIVVNAVRSTYLCDDCFAEYEAENEEEASESPITTQKEVS